MMSAENAGESSTVRPELRRAMDGLARKVLPVRPGDMIVFHVSGNHAFIISSEEQATLAYYERSSIGQLVNGLMSGHGWCEMTILELDWEGYDNLWTIVRPPCSVEP